MDSISCPKCRSFSVTKKGTRKTKLGRRQMYRCTKCGKRFSLSALPTFTYPPEAILSAPVLFYLGFSIQETSARIHNRFHISPSLSTVARWIDDFGKRAGIKSFRKEIAAFGTPSTIIKRRLFKHRQLYLFQVHTFKLQRCGALFSGVTSYLSGVLSGGVTIDPESFLLRASTCEIEVPIGTPLPKASYESSIASIALKAAMSNYQRHAILQRYLLATDKYTVAAEVPVFLTVAETKEIFGKEGGLLGHIDFLQIFEYSALILDYKPNAAKEKTVISQLLLYAIALSKRTGLHLNKIQMAWFDNKDYFKISAIEAYFAFRKHRYAIAP